MKAQSIKALIIVTLLLLALTSCNKCEECTTTSTITETTTQGWGGNQPNTHAGATTTFKACGDDIDAVNGKSTTSTTTTPTSTIVTVTKTKCQ